MAKRDLESIHQSQSRIGGSELAILLAAAAMALTGCANIEKPVPPTAAASTSEAAPAQTAPTTERVAGPLTPADVQALATMNERLKQYVELRTKIERSMARLPKEATPEQIDANQRAMEKLVREARLNAKPGDIFTTEARPVIKRLLASVFGGPDGKQLMASIMDENQASPSAAKLIVNSRYPDGVPLTTVPLLVLQTLPELAADLEYRFIGNSLILLDVQTHSIADFIEDVLPK